MDLISISKTFTTNWCRYLLIIENIETDKGYQFIKVSLIIFQISHSISGTYCTFYSGKTSEAELNLKS